MRTLLLLVCFFPLFLIAQTDTTMVEQYCQVKCESPLFSGKVVIYIDQGDKKNLHQEKRLRDENDKLVKFNTVIDALNYMGKKGWTLVNAYPLTSVGNTPVYYYIFKKLFRRQDLVN